MNGGNLQAARGRLQEALETLLLAWDATRENWRDAQAEAFEKEHLQPIIEQIAVTGPAVAHMAQILGRAGRDCEE